MTHTYTVTGMHCKNCVQSVTRRLEKVPEVENVRVTLDPPQAIVTMNKHIPIDAFNTALGDTEYQLQGNAEPVMSTANAENTSPKSYFPLFLVFGYLLVLVAMRQYANGFSFALA